MAFTSERLLCRSEQESGRQCTASPTPVRDLKQAAFDSFPFHHCLQQRNLPPAKLKKRSFTQLHLDAGQVAANASLTKGLSRVQMAGLLNGAGCCRPILRARHATYVDWSMPKARLVMKKSTLHSMPTSLRASNFRQGLWEERGLSAAVPASQ